MTRLQLLGLLLFVLLGLFVVEVVLHARRLRKIRIRVHVNGTRGKSSVVRLIAAALREAGIVTCAKTTGTLARMILPDGREVPIFRPAGANIIEQKRIVAAAADHGAEALVVECMALQPELQALCEFKLLEATHGVITNARPDHLEVMGPTPMDVARALSGMTPRGGRMYTAEQAEIGAIADAARDRKSELCAIGPADVAAITAEELAGFLYTEHPDNVALALRVCADLGVEREVALRGMHRSRPDPGALTEHELDYFGRRLVFLNGFAANDPVSTSQLWHRALSDHADLPRKIAIFNCRADRPERSIQLGEEFTRWTPADHVVLMGTGTYLFARAASRAGFDSTRLSFVEDQRVDEIFEHVIARCGPAALVMGMGNVGGHGLELVQFFKNRSRPGPGGR